MGLLSTLTSAAGSLLGGDTLKDVGGIIDNLHTSGEEKAEAKELIFLTAVFSVLSVFDGNLQIAGEDFTIGAAYVPVYQTLLMTVYAAYFAGRSIEKVKQVAK